MHLGFSLKSMAVVLIAGCLVLLSSIIWAGLTGKLSARNALLFNIGEINRIDEVLTNSALLATATGDPSYADRYDANVVALDTLITASLAMFDSEIAREKLREIEAANQVLIGIESAALAMSKGAPNPDGYRQLRSTTYLENKERYSNGVAAAVAELERMAAAEIRLMKWALTALAGLLIVLGAAAIRLFWHNRFERRDRKLRDRQFQTMRALIGSFMDIQNNLLNNMVYFRTKAAHNLPFDRDEVDLMAYRGTTQGEFIKAL